MKRLRWTFFVLAWVVLLLVDIFYVPDLMNSHHGSARALGWLFGFLPWLMLIIAGQKLYALWQIRKEMKE